MKNAQQVSELIAQLQKLQQTFDETVENLGSGSTELLDEAQLAKEAGDRFMARLVFLQRELGSDQDN